MSPIDSRLPERFWSKCEISETGCWIWTAALTHNGYSRFKVHGKTVLAHRFSYEHLVGPIPRNLTLDHLCRTTKCVNPEHLEPVTMRVNVLRGETITAANAIKTHCHRGHLLAGDNLLIRKNGRRRCQTCEGISQRKMRRTKRYRKKHREYEAARRKRAD